ncbi:hypothetical protein [uncultured Desulfovibrio sp.]|uniref:hypothetical protein n=1 Tax=uncultured Desulfovibrio sp. TaxID=167968 RepID=UPI002607C0FE|nr:hypothetical protein [uncultured Desulfovibrio sp.]
MTRLEFDAAVQKICAAFVFPEPEDATLHAWHQVAGHMPLMASAWVVNEFIRRTARMTRGTNLGYELNALYEEYKKNRQVESFREACSRPREGCPDCSHGFPGWIRVHVHAHAGEGDYIQLFRCACNTDPRFQRFAAWTRDQIANFPFMEVLP